MIADVHRVERDLAAMWANDRLVDHAARCGRCDRAGGEIADDAAMCATGRRLMAKWKLREALAAEHRERVVTG